jgi:GT2 family glycosyltransferase
VRGLVSVVIVTRDRPELLAAALDALGRQTWARREVIVVDNGCSVEQGASQPSVGCGSDRSSGDSAPGAVETVARSRGARYVTAAGSTLGAARQRGVDAARGEIVAFTDDDCLPDERWLEVLVSTFRRQPGLAGVQGRTDAEAGPVGSHAIRVAGPDRLYRTCNIAYRREALELAGGFDPGFQGWFEDTALAARVLEYGPIGFEPGALVTHRAMPRRRLGREHWRVVLADERRLADTYPSFYRRARGPGFLSAVIARWLVGSPLKTLTREWRGILIDPRGYLALARLLLEERRELLAALLIDRRHLP